MKIPRLLILTFIALMTPFIPANAGSNPEWSCVDSVSLEYKAEKTYYELACADSMHCVVRGKGLSQWYQFLRGTTDGGNTWKDIYLDSSWSNGSDGPYHLATYIETVAYPSPDLIIAAGDSGKIIRSTDQGQTWEDRSLEKKYFVTTVKMLNNNYGIIEAYDVEKIRAEFFQTFNGGIDWIKMKTPDGLSDSTLYEDYFIIKEGLFVTRYVHRPKILYDPYKDFTFIRIEGDWDNYQTYNQEIFDVFGYKFYFINENQGWMVGGRRHKSETDQFSRMQEIYYTNDGGKSWIAQRDTFFTGDPINGVNFYNDRFGIATGSVGYAYVTHNGSKTWEQIKIVDPDLYDGRFWSIRSPQLTSYSSGYVIVDLEYVYKFTRDWSIPHDTSGSPDDSVKSFFPSPPPGIVRFLGNYPNPFSEKTKIAYYLGEPRQVSLKIYDMRGRELETILEDFQSEGYHETDYVNKTLPPGIYYYRLRAGDRTFTRKMIIINY
ncbi:MAG: T9SS type A sorting domain-containing protein [Chloroflexota bacterium]